MKEEEKQVVLNYQNPDLLKQWLNKGTPVFQMKEVLLKSFYKSLLALPGTNI